MSQLVKSCAKKDPKSGELVPTAGVFLPDLNVIEQEEKFIKDQHVQRRRSHDRAAKRDAKQIIKQKKPNPRVDPHSNMSRERGAGQSNRSIKKVKT